jgi:hypothetical protein
MWRWYLVVLGCGFVMSRGPEWLPERPDQLSHSAQGDLLLAVVYGCGALGTLAFLLPGLYLAIRSYSRHRQSIPEPAGPPPWFMWPAVVLASLSVVLVQLFNQGFVR